MIKQLFRKLILQSTPQEKAMQELFAIKLKKSDIAIDCGANVGKVTYHLYKSGATVYAFEPNPHAFKVLKAKFINSPNVHCLQLGIAVSNGKQKLYFHQSSDQDEVYWSTGSSLLSFKGNVVQDKYLEIEVIDLCKFIENLNSKIRLLKIDVEGVECPIVTKLINTDLVNRIDYVFVETHEHKVPELKLETDKLRALISKRGIKNINLNWT